MELSSEMVKLNEVIAIHELGHYITNCLLRNSLFKDYSFPKPMEICVANFDGKSGDGSMGYVKGIGFDCDKHCSDFLVKNKAVAIGFLFTHLGGFVFDQIVLKREKDAWWNSPQYNKDNENFKDILIGFAIDSSTYQTYFNRILDTLTDYFINNEWITECKDAFFISLLNARKSEESAWIYLRSENFERLEKEIFEIIKGRNLNKQITVLTQMIT